jgi:hypothetical protein
MRDLMRSITDVFLNAYDIVRLACNKWRMSRHVAALAGTASGIVASGIAEQPAPKYGIGLVTGLVICVVFTKVLNFIDKRIG